MRTVPDIDGKNIEAGDFVECVSPGTYAIKTAPVIYLVTRVAPDDDCLDIDCGPSGAGWFSNRYRLVAKCFKP